MPKFIHAADLHLDSPLTGLSRYAGAPEEEIRGATRAALRNLVALAAEERVDFVLIAGDIYDGDWRDFNTGLYFVAQMGRLHDLKIPVVMIKGNHDAVSQIAKSLRLPPNVTWLSHKKPETKILDDFGIAIHGQSYENRAVDFDMTGNYPAAEKSLFNIGLLHTLAEGQEGHDRYAPCTLDGLRAKQYDYWALGHVHTRALLSPRDPVILFPGNTQGRHARETGSKGCTIVTCDGPRILELKHRDLHVVQWELIAIDAGRASSDTDVLTLVSDALRAKLASCDGRLLAARIEVYGPTRAHAALHADTEQFVNEIRSAANGLGAQIWIEKVKLLTRPAATASTAPVDGTPLGSLLRAIEESPSAALFDEASLEEIRALQEKLPRELTAGPEQLNLCDAQQLAALVDGGRALLLSKIRNAAAGAAT